MAQCRGRDPHFQGRATEIGMSDDSQEVEEIGKIGPA